MSRINVTVRTSFGAEAKFSFNHIVFSSKTKQKGDEGRSDLFEDILNHWGGITGAEWKLMIPHIIDASDDRGNDDYFAFSTLNPIDGTTTYFACLRSDLTS